MNDYREQERALESQLLSGKGPVSADNFLTVQRIFELANRAHFLYLTRNSTERGQLLKSVLLNCATDGISFTPTFRKPFDLIFERLKTENWSGRLDLNQRPPAPKAGALPGCATPRLSTTYSHSMLSKLSGQVINLPACRRRHSIVSRKSVTKSDTQRQKEIGSAAIRPERRIGKQCISGGL